MAVARLTGISDQSLRRWATFDRAEAAKIRGPNQIKLAKLLEYETWESFVAAAESTPMPTPYASMEQFVTRHGMWMAPAGSHNVRMDTEQKHPADELEITLGVAACHWVAVDEAAGFFNGRPMHGRFSIVISGDCMEDKWMNGDRVTFEMLDAGESDFVVNKDYLIVRDGQATFKRCSKVGEHHITLKAFNKRYKETWKIARVDIQRAAVAKYAHVVRPG